MDCIELVELVTDYIEHALPQADRDRLEAHLIECPHCVLYIQQMRVTLSVLGRIPVDSITKTARERLMKALHDWKRR